MPTFALITEGITDQAALELILEGHYRDRMDDEIYVNPLQPVRDDTDLSRRPRDAFGGWELVFEHCSFHDKICDALATNDYLVIQIDTDCGDQPNYGVPLTDGGRDRPAPAVIEDVRAKIIALLGLAFYEGHKDRILFAICVHSLECWLIPLHETQAKKNRKTKNCIEHFQSALSRSGSGIRYEKNHPIYCNIASDYRKRGVIAANAEFNESFKIFIASLPTLSVCPQ